MFASRPAVHPVEAPPTTEATPVRVRMKDYQGTPGTVGSLVLRLLQFLFAIAAVCVMATTSDFVTVHAFCYFVAATALQSLWSLSLAFVDVYVLLVKCSLRSPRVIGLFAFGDGGICQTPVSLHHTKLELRNSYLSYARTGSLARHQFSWFHTNIQFSTVHPKQKSALESAVHMLSSKACSSTAHYVGKFHSFILKPQRIKLQITVTLTFAAACSSAGITVLIGNDLNICADNHCASFEAATAMAFLSWFAASSSFLLNFWSLASR